MVDENDFSKIFNPTINNTENTIHPDTDGAENDWKAIRVVHIWPHLRKSGGICI